MNWYLTQYETSRVEQWICLQMALFLSPFKGIYLNIAWYIFAIVFLTVKLKTTLNSHQMHLLYNSAFAKCLVTIHGFFGSWIFFLHQSPSGSQIFQQMEWFGYTTLEFSEWGRKIELKQKSVSLFFMRKGPVFVVRIIIGAKHYL